MGRPDLAAWLAHRVRADLAGRWPGLPAGKQRPADTVNLSGPFVRVLCTGGPETRAGTIWKPGLLLECWADTIDDAEDLNTAATDTLRAAEGHHGPGWHLTQVGIYSSGAFAPSEDGHPVVITTATITVALPTPEMRTLP